MLFRNQLFSLTIMFARFTHVVALIRAPFLFISNHIPLYGFITFYWSIARVTGVWVVFIFFTIVTDSAIALINKFLCGYMFSFPLGR